VHKEKPVNLIGFLFLEALLQGSRWKGELLFEKKFVKKRILTIFASPKHMGQSSKRNGLLRS